VDKSNTKSAHLAVTVKNAAELRENVAIALINRINAPKRLARCEL
jgi:hypothetical protein